MLTSMGNVHTALAEAATQIARRDAEALLGHVLGRDRAWVFAHPEAVLGEQELGTLRHLVQRRAAHEPLQYLTGVQEFYGLKLQVTADTLIPRPETELLVEQVLAWAAQQPNRLRLLDVGTGTGAIALALAAHLPQAEIVACDVSAAALAVARQNAERLGLGSRMRFVESDLLAAFAAGTALDAIVSNPPYVATGDAAGLQRDVVDYEPHLALFAGEDGLEVYRRLIPQARLALRPGGLLALEFGFGQQQALAELLVGWSEVGFVKDYAGIPRVALAWCAAGAEAPFG